MTESPFAFLRDHIVPPEIVEIDSRYRQEVIGGKPMPAWDLDGVCWTRAPRPRWLHRHWPQTVGLIGPFTEVWRCPCGGIRLGGDRWRRG